MQWHSESKIARALKSCGGTIMAPITENFEKDANKKRQRKESKVAYMARRVARKASHLSTSMRNTHINSVSNSKNIMASQLAFLIKLSHFKQ